MAKNASYSEDGPGAGRRAARPPPSKAIWQGWHHPKCMTVFVFAAHHIMTVVLILGLFGTAWGVTPPEGTQMNNTAIATGSEFGLLYTKEIKSTIKDVYASDTKAQSATSEAKAILVTANKAGIGAFIVIMLALYLALVVNVVLWVLMGWVFKKRILHCCCTKTNLHCTSKFVIVSVFVEFVLVLSGWAGWVGWWLTTGYDVNLKALAAQTAASRSPGTLKAALKQAYSALGWSCGLTLLAWLILLAMLIGFSFVFWWWCCCGRKEEREAKAREAAGVNLSVEA